MATTTIQVSGQISGNFKLKNAINDGNCEVHLGMFNTFRLTFKSKKLAIKALSEAAKHLRLNDYKVSYKRGHMLMYDASSATIKQ